MADFADFTKVSGLRNESPLELTKKLILDPKNQIKLDEVLQKEMESVNDNITKLGINHKHLRDEQLFKNYIFAIEKNTQLLANMMQVIGRWGVGQEKISVTNFIQNFCSEATINSKNELPQIVNLRIYPLIIIATSYGVGIIHAGIEQWSRLYEFLDTTVDMRDFLTRNRIVDNLLLHTWEGRMNPIWRTFEDPHIENSGNIEFIARRESLKRIAFLDHFTQKIRAQFERDFSSAVNFKRFIYEFKILGTLIFMERFESSKIYDLLTYKTLAEYDKLRFSLNSEFFNEEMRIIDLTLSVNNLEKLKQAGFKRTNSESIEIFKMFYIDLHYFQEKWCENKY